MSTPPPPTYISVDIETAGPYPGAYSLLAIGACTLGEPRRTFYVELQPVNGNSQAGALAVHGLELEQLATEGQPPAEAMAAFAAWLGETVPAGGQPLFVGFNAPFDWMFVADYFHRYLGYNPFGHAALDIKAFYMGLAGVPWNETSLSCLSARFPDIQDLIHHALDDAIVQAQIFERLLALQQPPSPW